MHKQRIVVFMVLLIFGAIGILLAAQPEANPDRGKALFNDPKLGTNGKTCSTCHPGGKGLEHAAANKDLASMINGCISQPLMGTPLDVTSMDMQSLVLYVKSFGEKKPAATKKPPVGC